MKKIEIYSKDWCPFCAGAKSLLESKRADYIDIDVTQDPLREREMNQRSGRFTVPQVFVDGELVGGYDDLARLEANGYLDERLGLISESGPEVIPPRKPSPDTKVNQVASR